ncbi:MAG: hypothetical protein ACKVIY_14110, partial [Acidimicrobiales bacterium]
MPSEGQIPLSTGDPDMRKILLFLTLTVALVASACSSDDSWSTGEDGGDDNNSGAATSNREIVIEIDG